MILCVHAATDIGLVRHENQDSLLVDEARAFYAVADGVGGLPAGAESSQVAVATLRAHLLRHPPGTGLDMVDAFRGVNRAVVELGRRLRHEYNTGTTLTAAQVLDGRLHFGHVGDSSIHLFRGASLQKLTLDHTVASDLPYRYLYADNAQAAAAVKNVLTRCMGSPQPPEVDTGSVALRPDDFVLLGTDGIHKGVEVEEIHAWLGESNDPATLVRRLLATVNERGGYDNATAIGILVVQPE